MDISLWTIFSIILGAFALTFILAGVLKYLTGEISEDKATHTTGTLVAFRDFNDPNKYRSGYKDRQKNGKGFKPLIHLQVDGEDALVAAAMSDYSLSEADLGRELPVIYKRGIGITLLINDAQSIKYYKQLQKTIFWVLEAIGIILAAMAILACIILPKIFG